MKKAAKVLLQAVKWVAVLVILLFALATLLGGSYLQTVLLVLAVVVLAWWPSKFNHRWSHAANLVVRGAMVILLLISAVMFFRSGPEYGIYKTEELQNELMDLYDERVQAWPTGTEDRFVTTSYGEVHVLVCGSVDLAPIVLVHAASMGAHSWAETLEPLIRH